MCVIRLVRRITDFLRNGAGLGLIGKSCIIRKESLFPSALTSTGNDEKTPVLRLSPPPEGRILPLASVTTSKTTRCEAREIVEALANRVKQNVKVFPREISICTLDG
ncbi:hypothetical protein GE061_008521 [Apolygus lucorum]|uniref:Uncharacterized protein n=1 Tax=Apolygus lucorum TaxID=248454 RepID=A0A8S9WKN9_APOLU|nr:hypothetical protein GE061_008521 [Apolygus lucorum]